MKDWKHFHYSHSRKYKNIYHCNYWLVDLDKEYEELSEQKYYILLSKQLEWLDSNYDKVKKKSSKLYQLYITNKLPNNIKDRCCNFKLLEEKCALYNEDHIYV